MRRATTATPKADVDLESDSGAVPPAEQESLAQLLRLFAATYLHDLDSAAERLGLTRTQAVLLGEAGRPGSIRELAARIGCDPSNLSAVVQRLRKRELIAIVPDPADRRVKRITLTRSGRRTVGRLNDGARLLARIASASPEEAFTLRAVLERALHGDGTPHDTNSHDPWTENTN
jgi:DNA-binding MarR family transcriptional regulator